MGEKLKNESKDQQLLEEDLKTHTMKKLEQ
jgi:hypothetical protein